MVVAREMIVAREMVRQKHITLTFSPKTNSGEGKVCSLLEQFTEDLWIKAALPSVVKTFRFSLWKQILGYKPKHSKATTCGKRNGNEITKSNIFVINHTSMI